MKKTEQKPNLKSEKGLAMIETVPLLLVFCILLGYSIGCFGVIHSAILGSIAARNYAFETFRHRANLNYQRDVGGAYVAFRSGNRIHTSQSEFLSTAGTGIFPATERMISMGWNSDRVGRTESDLHNVKVFSVQTGRQNRDIRVNPVWLQIQYGICLTVECGGGKD